jgi:hypothetical protein
VRASLTSTIENLLVYVLAVGTGLGRVERGAAAGRWGRMIGSNCS